MVTFSDTLYSQSFTENPKLMLYETLAGEEIMYLAARAMLVASAIFLSLFSP